MLDLDLTNLSVSMFANVGMLSAITIAVSSLLKNLIPERFYAILPVLIGIGISCTVLGFGKVEALVGLVIGLTAAGLYDQKNIVK